MERVVVAAALILREGRFLITQRPPGSHLEGLWEFPGGKLQDGESLPECLRREVEEETGLLIEVDEEARQVDHRYPDREVRLHFFHCRPVQGEARAIGCSAVAWVEPAEMARHRFPEADAPLVADIIAGRIPAGESG